MVVVGIDRGGIARVRLFTCRTGTHSVSHSLLGLILCQITTRIAGLGLIANCSTLWIGNIFLYRGLFQFDRNRFSFLGDGDNIGRGGGSR